MPFSVYEGDLRVKLYQRLPICQELHLQFYSPHQNIFKPYV